MGMPVLIGAGVGALSSAAMGKSPLTGALLGGATGGAFGGAEGFGSGFTQGGFLSSAAPAATTSATSGAGVQLAQAPIKEGLATSLTPTVAGGGGTGINISPYLNVADDGLGFAAAGAPSTGIPLSFNQGIDALKLDPRRLVVDTPLTFGERLSDVGSSAFSYGKDNPMTLLGGANALSGLNTQNNQEQQQRLNTAVATGTQGITRPNFDPSSAIAAAPSYALSRDEVSKGKMAQIASQARLNDEDERRIGQFYQSLIG
jgi:hypothetical protein